MSDLRELYQEMILDHSKHPRHFEALEPVECRSDGHNPLCGDRITVFVNTSEGKIAEIGFQGSGCAISIASASMMASELEGKTILETEAIFKNFHEMVTGKTSEPVDRDLLGKLVVFEGVKAFPVRIKCATLAWHTLMASLEHRRGTVSTE